MPAFTADSPSVQTENYVIRDTNLIIGGGDEYVLRVGDMPSEDKPREKLEGLGPAELELHELVAVLIGRGTRKEDVISMSRRIVRLYGERSLSAEKVPNKLAEALDIPRTKAMQIIAAIEIGRRFHAQKDGKPVFIRSAFQAFEHVRGMADLPKEQLRGLYLNNRRQLIHEEVISLGSLTASIIHPREVFRPAVEHGAVGVIIAHNHPSGDIDPSVDDLCATVQLSDAGKALGIELLDHLIVVKDSFNSIINKAARSE